MSTEHDYPYDGYTSNDPYAATRAYEANRSMDGYAVFDQSGFDLAGYDREGYGRDGYDRAGFDRSGYDRAGFDRAGYGRDGFDRDGFDRSGSRRGDHREAGSGSSGGEDLGELALSTGRRALLLIAVSTLVCGAAVLALTALDGWLPASYRGDAAPVQVSWEWGIGAGLMAGAIGAVVGLLVLLLGGTGSIVSWIGYAITVIVALLWYQNHRGIEGMWPTTTVQVIVLTLAGLVVTACAASMLVPAAWRRSGNRLGGFGGVR